MATRQGGTPRSRSSSSAAAAAGPPEPGGSPASAEHADGGEEALDAGDLTDSAERELAPGGPDPGGSDRARAEQRDRDQLLVEAVLQQGLGGPWHRALEDELIRYAIPVLKHLLRTGQIVSKATRLRRPPSPASAWLYFTDDDREEFAQEMAAAALDGFTKAVFEKRRWTPGRGASLKTYFVNAGILQFARLQRQWLADRQAVRPCGLEPDPGTAGPAPDPATAVAVRDEAAQALSMITDEKLREALVLRAAGWSAADAAQQAGLRPKAAESSLGRIRKNLANGRAGTEPRASGQPETRQGGR